MAVAGSGSLVSNILKQAATLDDIHLEESIGKVEKKCIDLREEILLLLKQTYDEFIVCADSTISIEQRVKELVAEFKRLSSKVDDDLKGRLAKSIGKKEEIEKQFNDAENKIKFVEKLVQVHTNLEQTKQDINRRRYSIAAKRAADTADLQSEIGQGGCDAKVYQALKNELALVTSDLKCQLQEEWNSYVKWKPAVPTQELNIASAVELTHTIPRGNVPEFGDVNESMKHVFTETERERRVHRYATRLLDGFIKPLLKNQHLQLKATSSETSCTISFQEVVDPRKLESCIDSIVQLFTTLHEMMTPESERDQWMILLGQTIEPDFTPLFLKYVLSEHMPKTTSERGEFANTSLLVAKLQEKMKEVCLVDSSYSALTEYTVNVDTHMATQQCQSLLAEARDLLLLPLHNTTKVGIEDTQVALQTLNIHSRSSVKEQVEDDFKLSGSPDELDISSLTFAFPSCLISDSIKRFVTLLYSTLLRCTVSSPNTAVQLYYTARDMVELLIAISTAHHQDTVSQIPRNAVVQHNNYMYVAHHMITIGHQFHSVIKCTNAVSFIDYVPRLQKLGEDCFLSEMERQSNNILECLSPFQTFDGVSERQDGLQQAIKQSVLSIYKLSKVYLEVLHSELYRRCQGGLLNVLVNELISRTLSLVDIASSDANALNEVFAEEVVQKAPVALSLLSPEDEGKLSQLCQNWEKLKELVFILGAGQSDIVHRWDKGKGPLAKQFSVAEVKQLIRAIFKNTERRAESLAKIV